MKRLFQKGFTLIELIVVIVIIGILAAIAIPKFIDLGTEATNAALDGISGAAKAGLALYYAEHQVFPTVTDLVTTITGDANPTAMGTGIQVTVNNTTHIIPTYTDDACTAATSLTSDTVLCVGSAPHI